MTTTQPRYRDLHKDPIPISPVLNLHNLTRLKMTDCEGSFVDLGPCISFEGDEANNAMLKCLEWYFGPKQGQQYKDINTLKKYNAWKQITPIPTPKTTYYFLQRTMDLVKTKQKILFTHAADKGVYYRFYKSLLIEVKFLLEKMMFLDLYFLSYTFFSILFVFIIII